MKRILDILWLRLRSLFRGAGADRDLQRELRAHLEAHVDELVARGMAPAEARRAALRAFGGVAGVEDACRDTRRVRLIENVVRDVRYTCRQLLRQPVFALAATAAVALGAGATATIVGLANDLLLSTPTAREPHRLVRIRTNRGSHVAYPTWRALEESGALSGVAGYDVEEQVNWRGSEESLRLTPLLVTSNYFDVLGVSAAYGRTFTAADVRRGAELAVISHRFWQRRLGADPGVVGRALTLNGRPYAVVGVLSPDLRSLAGYGMAPEVYLPISRMLVPDLDDARAPAVMLAGRLREGQSVAEGRAAVGAALAGLSGGLSASQAAAIKDFEPVGGLSQAREFKEVALFFGVLLVLAVLVFMIACANVAGLLLARSAFRRREIALRLALGAGRGRLVQQLLTEGAVLAAVGTAGGLALALVAGQLVQLIALPLPVPIELHVRLTGRLFFMAAGLVVAGTLLSSLAPALGATRASFVAAIGADHAPVLRLGRRLTFRRLLVIGQVAVSCVLLVIAVLFVRNLARTSLADPGFDVTRTLMAQVSFVEGRQLTGTEPTVVEMVRRVGALPGVETAAFARGVPLTIEGISSTGTDIRVDGAAAPVRVEYEGNVVGPEYFGAMGIRLVRGREFSTQDRSGSPRVAIVNQEFARRYLEGRDPIGARLHLPGPSGPAAVDTSVATEVVGVAADSKYRTFGEDRKAAIYESYLQRAANARLTHVIVRAAGPPEALAPAVRDAILGVDGSAAAMVQPMRAALAFAFLPSQAGAALTAVLGLVGLALAMLGLHGVVAYATGQRTREIGVRLTLGASRASIVRLVLADAAGVAGLGVAIGLGLAAVITPLLSTFLMAGLSATDPLSFVATALLLVAVSVAASWGPVHRALGVDPSVVLKSQ
jgi:predicted permease